MPPSVVTSCVGGYHARDQLVLVPLDDMQSRVVQPVMEDGAPLTNFRGQGRGARLYLETADDVFVIDPHEVE